MRRLRLPDLPAKGRRLLARLASLPRPPHRAAPLPASSRPSEPSFAPWLVVMVRRPTAGRVKTRLARQVGAVAATSYYRHATAAVLSRIGGGSRWRTVLAVTPDHGDDSPAWTGRFQLITQGSGDLGHRLDRVIVGLPPGPAVVIGTDIPHIAPKHIQSAFRKLGSNDAVFGPAPDGGYWLIGLRRRPRIPRAFANVRWSSRHALEDTRANLAGLKVANIAALPDVDEAADLVRFRSVLGRRVLPAAV